jgi:hypothetical protein
MWYKEWTECRSTIGRFDSILSDLRKFGFTLVTGLITAGALLGSSTPTLDERAAAFAAIMFLVFALFLIDMYYDTLLVGAVERALDLEERRKERDFRINHYLSANTKRTGAIFAILALYLGLLFATFYVGFYVAASAATAPTIITDQATWSSVQVGLVNWLTVLVVIMGGYWLFTLIRTGALTDKDRASW